MGVVFSGQHPRSGRAVALKVLTDKGAFDPRYQRAFREEVRASAALDHPRIVSTFDVGRLAAPLKYVDDGWQALCPEGSPFLVMERVHGEPLTRWRGQVQWAPLRHIVLALLDALAHAHARGVIHRDLKPSNVLWFPCKGAFDLKLTDFGLAHALDRDGRLSGGLARGGTPAYMSPEQIEGRWRDFGPWTDLYALGCLIHALVSGHSPFARPTAKASQEAHRTLTPPPLLLDEAPPGFSAWVDRLLCKSPEGRFRCAADAAWAFVGLDERPFEGPVPWVAPLGMEQGPAPLEEPASEPSTAWYPSGAQEVWFDAVTAVGASPQPSDAPPIPTDWRTPGVEDGRWAPRPPGMGLALFDQRSTPLVGRGPLCDELWSSLRLVDAFRGPRGVVLEGAGGVGKSTLARWLTLKASALGAATVLKATHSQSLGPFDGLGPMVARAHQCLGLSREALKARLDETLSKWSIGGSAEALTGVIAGDLPGTRGVSRFERLADHLGRLARQRPLIVWVDDAQWGPEALSFGLHLFDQAARGRPLPILMVITINTDRPPSGRAEILLRRWRQRPEVQRRRIDPLEAPSMGALVTEILGLSPPLAQEVIRRTRGNPLFAVQLVGDWVHRALLESGPEGFRRTGEAPESLPDELHLLWQDRLRYALRVLTFDGWWVMERGAILGQTVDLREWAAACGFDRGPARERMDLLLNRLADEGLMLPQAEGTEAWRFVHPMLQEALIRHARESGRLVAHHLACAQMLEGRRVPLDQGRRGEHLLAAGEAHQALKPLYTAAWDRAIARDFERAEIFARRWRAAARQSGLKADDPRRGQGVILASRIARGRGQGRRSRWMIEALEKAARRFGWGEVRARALVDRAWALENEGLWAQAADLLDEAAELAHDLGLRGLEASTRRNLGAILMQRAGAEEARRPLLAAMDLHRGGRWPHGEALCHLELAQLDRMHGALSEAAAHCKQARAIFERCNAPWGVAAADLEQGRVCQALGDLSAAESLIAGAVEQYRATQSEGRPVAELSLAWVRLAQGHVEQARTIFDTVEGHFARAGRRGRALSATLGRLAVGLGVTTELHWDRLLERVEVELAAHHTREIDHLLHMLRALADRLGTEEQIEALAALRLEPDHLQREERP